MIARLPAEIDENSNGCERRGNLLLESTIQFCNDCKHRYSNENEIFTKLFYSLIGDTKAATKIKISAHLARNIRTPRPIAYYFAIEPIEIAAPFLLISPVFWERDLLQLVEKLSTPYLAILARRSDISSRLAQALISRGDKLVCQILSKNPVLKLNSVKLPTRALSPLDHDDTAHSNKSISFSKSGSELLKLAGINNNLANETQSRSQGQPHATHLMSVFYERILKHARAKQYHALAREIGNKIGMSVVDVEKIVRHENSASLAIFLKGLNVPRSDVSQILLLVNQRTGKNIADFTGSIARYDELSVAECMDIMKNLGARNLDFKKNPPAAVPRDTVLNSATTARRTQILNTRPKMTYREQQKAG
ncbi:MAG: DUF2336 domain-containing protein [Rhizobiaceae bacterium]|nr:DUF2336 domain-containing protein [Rhizobiaceae bacterium]